MNAVEPEEMSFLFHAVFVQQPTVWLECIVWYSK